MFSRFGKIYLNNALAILTHFNIEKTTIIGASFGGYVAIDFALMYPEYVEKLILVAPAFGGYEFKSAEMLNFFAEEEKLFKDGYLDSATELNLKMWVDGPQRDAKDLSPEIRELVGEMQMKIFSQPEVEDVDERELSPAAFSRLHEIEMPTLVISGDLDVAEFQEISKLVATSIPNAKLEIMANVAHLPSLEKPDEFNRLLFDFLR